MKPADLSLILALLPAPKRVAPAHWVKDLNKKKRELGQTIQCDFDGSQTGIERLRLDIRVCVGRLDQVTFHSHLKVPGRRVTIPVFRLDLNPGASHVNPIRDQDPDGGRTFAERETHEHSIEDDQYSGLIRFARTPKRPLLDFADAWSYFCDRMVIENPRDLPTPSPQGLLL